MQSIELTTPLALLGLLLLIPIIILYLIKPKPRHIRFPSIMFILGVERSKRFRSFFKRFIRDPLLIIQILIITLLVFAISEPFFIVREEENVKENSVIIIDSSASMQSTDITPSRFSRAKEIAKELIGKMNEESLISIVIAENIPILLSKNLNKEDAKYSVENALPSDSPSNIGDAILFSRDILPKSGINKRIYVLSDLSPGGGTDIMLAQRLASRENISVNFVKINGDGGNIGIVDINAKRFITNRYKFYLTFTVRNFYDEDKEVVADIFMDNESLISMKKDIAANSEKLFDYEGSISEDPHCITVKLRNEDFLSADDIALAFLPGVKKHKVLLVTDDESDLYLRYALESSRDIDLRIAVPPLIPKFDEFDVVILGELKPEFILPGTFRDLRFYAENNGNIIFLASSDLCNFENKNLDELIPVELDSLRTEWEEIHVQLDHEILIDVVPKGSKRFPNIITKKHIKCSGKNESVVIATTGNSPAIAYQKYGNGKVAFIGINPNANWSNFYYSSSFPIFWLQLINWITREEPTIGINNFKTGDYLPVVGGMEIKTPSGKRLNATNLILDEIGFYDISYGDRIDKIAVSLSNEKESDISNSLQIEAIGDENFTIKKEMFDVRKDIFPYILILVLFFFFIEAFYYRRRGML